MSHNHLTVKCKHCDDVMATSKCRCMNPIKAVTYAVCPSCVRKQANAVVNDITAGMDQALAGVCTAKSEDSVSLRDGEREREALRRQLEATQLLAASLQSQLAASQEQLAAARDLVRELVSRVYEWSGPEASSHYRSNIFDRVRIFTGVRP